MVRGDHRDFQEPRLSDAHKAEDGWIDHVNQVRAERRQLRRHICPRRHEFELWIQGHGEPRQPDDLASGILPGRALGREHKPLVSPVPEVLAWFRQYGEHFRHIALTATSLHGAPASAAWVMRHFGRWLRSFHVIPSPREGEQIPAYDRTKEDFLRWYGRVDILIDDNPFNVAAAQALDIQTILIPRPWNQSRLTLAEALDALTGLAEKT